MEDNAKLIEPLFERATDYGKTTYELLRLKTIDKAADIVSSIVPQSFVLIFVGIFMLFLSIGLAFWIGDLLGKIYMGFICVAALYGVIALVFHFLLNNWLKKLLSDYIIKQILK